MFSLLKHAFTLTRSG